MQHYDKDDVYVTLALGPDGRMVARLRGEIDLANAAALGDLLERLLEEHEALEVDLGELEFMDSSGLHLLDGLRARAAQEGWPVWLTGAGGTVARLLAIANEAG